MEGMPQKFVDDSRWEEVKVLDIKLAQLEHAGKNLSDQEYIDLQKERNDLVQKIREDSEEK